jgi:hypothetical protein
MAYVPCVGDANVTGYITFVWTGSVVGGLLLADQIQGETGTQYSGPPNSGNNPLQFPYYGNSFAPGTRVKFTVAQGPYAPYATDVVAY